jgi:hypothetical protein
VPVKLWSTLLGPWRRAFIHSPVKCNKSLYIFTRCIVLLVYLITFELLKQSTINQKTKWYYNHLDINFIKIHPFYKHNKNYPIFNRETWENWLIYHAGYSETRCKLVILNVFIGQFWIFGHYRPRSLLFRVPLPSCSTVCIVPKNSKLANENVQNN